MKILTKKMLAGKNFQRFSYPNDMDKEMIDFMDILNNIPGCRTMFCCAGHKFGGWYFVVNCCYDMAKNVIVDYFSARKTSQITEHSDNSLKGFLKERTIAVYDRTFDSQTFAEKRKAYRDMCNYFLHYVPDVHWRAEPK